MSNFLRIIVRCLLDQVSINLLLSSEDRDVLSVRTGSVRLQRGLQRHVRLKVMFTICYRVNGSVSHQRIQICKDNFQESEHSLQTKLQWKFLSCGEGPSDEGLLAESQELTQSTESRKPETNESECDIWFCQCRPIFLESQLFSGLSSENFLLFGLKWQTTGKKRRLCWEYKLSYPWLNN